MPTWRRLLYCLLCLALPLQSLAGSGPGLCGPGHGGMATGAHAPVAAPAPAGAAHAGHGEAGQMAHAGPSQGAADHAAHAAAPGASVPGALGDEAAPGDPATAAGQCSACASCCAPAALLPAGLGALPEVAPAPTLTMRPVSSVPRFITGGPDRPPRTPLA